MAIIVTAIQLTHSATLRRKPKVYNALITTDQNLTPSRAFPVIQPHLQETYAYPSYSYRSYGPLGLYNNGFQYGSAATSYNGFHHSYPRVNPGLVQGRNFFSRGDIENNFPISVVTKQSFQMIFIPHYRQFQMILVCPH